MTTVSPTVASTRRCVLSRSKFCKGNLCPVNQWIYSDSDQSGVYHHYHSCQGQDRQAEEEYTQGTGWVRVNIEVLPKNGPVRTKIQFHRLRLTLMPFTLAETFFKFLIVVQKSFKHPLIEHNFLSYLKWTDPCLVIPWVFFSYRRPSTTRSAPSLIKSHSRLTFTCIPKFKNDMFTIWNVKLRVNLTLSAFPFSQAIPAHSWLRPHS